MTIEPAQDARSGRNAYVDWLRAISLLVVVVWHWAFTILYWRPDGPHATSPLGFTKGFWLITWLFQVMPLFFYIGGYVHLRSWERARQRNVRLGPFVTRRLRQLAVPAGLLLVTWLALGAAAQAYFGWSWMGRAVELVVSPLWFLAVYLMLIALLPVALRLHNRYGQLVLIWLAGAAMCVDVLRFRYDMAEVAWLNMVLVWGLAHQAGFFYQGIVAAPRRTDWALLWAGLFGLVGLVFSGLYPGSMVGVPGEKFSNMAPPTFVIVSLLLFQIGVVELLRPTMERLLARPRWQVANQTINRFALPLFLFHTTGMAISLFVFYVLDWYKPAERPSVTPMYWATRPLALVGPLLCTLPVIWLFGRGRQRDRAAATASAPLAAD
jgi:peptidoglycan/LPS O-acetylase OafA/YrhL